MKSSLRNQQEYEWYETMFANITDISLSRNITPFSTDIDEVIRSAKVAHEDECDQLKHGIIGPFTRTIVMQLPIRVHTIDGKEMDLQCKIWSRTMQNLINDDIVENIRSSWSVDILDIDFEFDMGTSEFSEYHFSQEKFYKDIKQHIMQFIKQTPQIEKTIVENYCDWVSATLWYMKTKEPLIDQWEKTTRELFHAFGMPKDFVLQRHNRVATDAMVLGTYGNRWEKLLSSKQQNTFRRLLKIGNELNGFDVAHETKRYIEDIKKNTEEIKQIIITLQQGQQEIELDSKFFFLDNGDNLYDEVIEHSAYTKYYTEELNLIQENKKRIEPYIKRKYIGLWCGNGKKDYSIVSDDIETGMTPITPIPESNPWKIGKVVLMDSSLRSLAKAEKLMSRGRGERWKAFWSTTIVFSQEWIDGLIKENEIKTLTSVTYNPKESTMNIPDIRESSNMFTLFGWTFGNFENYQKLFLQQMDTLMNSWDILCISVFNLPKDKQEREQIVRSYNTPQNNIFIKNFFIKMGIPEDAIEICVEYDNETDTVHIDAKIHGKTNQPIQINYAWEKTIVPDGTIFHCISSQRMDVKDLQKRIDQSKTSLKIIDQISSPNSPFTLYMISK